MDGVCELGNSYLLSAKGSLVILIVYQNVVGSHLLVIHRMRLYVPSKRYQGTVSLLLELLNKGFLTPDLD